MNFDFEKCDNEEMCLASYEKIATSHNNNEIIQRLNKFWSHKERLKNLYNTFLKEFNIKPKEED